MCTRGLRDYDWFYSLKILAHFRSKVLVDFHHSITQINCLTGAIISETYIRHILRSLYLTTIRSSTIRLFLSKEYQERSYNIQQRAAVLCRLTVDMLLCSVKCTFSYPADIDTGAMNWLFEGLGHWLIIYIDDNAHEKLIVIIVILYHQRLYTAIFVSCTAGLVTPPPPLPQQMNTLSSAKVAN